MPVTGIQTLILDECPSDAHFEEWRTIARDVGMGEVWPTTGTTNDFRGLLKYRKVDDMTFIDAQSTPFAGRYMPDEPSSDLIGIGICADGYAERVVTRHQDEHILTSKMHFIDNSDVLRYEQMGGGAGSWVLFPRSALSSVGRRVEKLDRIFIWEDSTAARVLSALVNAVRTEPNLADNDAVAVRNAILELLVGAASDGIEHSSRAVSDAMRLQVERWVVDHLHEGRVSPSEAAAAHSISLRSLHRLFADVGETFGGLTRAVRVGRTRRDLIVTNDSVQVIAMRWGYSDASHFCREFKRAFGMTPGECRSDARGIDEPF